MEKVNENLTTLFGCFSHYQYLNDYRKTTFAKNSKDKSLHITNFESYPMT